MFETNKIMNLSELEIIIYNYIIEHPTEIHKMSIQELATKTHVSTTTVLRFCRNLGFNGYSEFKLRFQDEQKKKNLPNLSKLSNYPSYLEKYTTDNFQERLNKATNILKKSSHIVWLGFGASAGLCKYAANFFSSSQKINFVIDDPYFHSFSPLPPKTALVVLSVSGEIDNTIRILQKLKSPEVTIISITNYENSTLARISDYVIPYYITYNKFNDIDITTQLPVMFIIESLGTKLIE